MVGLPERFAGLGDSEAILRRYVAEIPMLARILGKAQWENDFPFRHIKGYSANVKTLHGRHFALLGNAAEFLDPVFSSGVTIAMHSAKTRRRPARPPAQRPKSRLAARICRTADDGRQRLPHLCERLV